MSKAGSVGISVSRNEVEVRDTQGANRILSIQESNFIYASRNKIYITPEDMQEYLIYGFTGLNEFCKKHNLDPEPTNKMITARLKDWK